MPYDYYRIQAGSENEPGINGGAGAIADTPTAEGKPLTQVTSGPVAPKAVRRLLRKTVISRGGNPPQYSDVPDPYYYLMCGYPTIENSNESSGYGETAGF